MEIDPKIVDTFRDYVAVRKQLLESVEAEGSNRDPLAELAERMAAVLLDAVPAKSRVNKGWDVRRRDGRTVEVKYVANSSDSWVNGHDVSFPPGRDEHALVVIVNLVPQFLLVFNEVSATRCYEGMKKSHDRGHDKKLGITPEMLRDMWNGKLDLTRFSVEVLKLPWSSKEPSQERWDGDPTLVRMGPESVAPEDMIECWDCGMNDRRNSEIYEAMGKYYCRHFSPVYWVRRGYERGGGDAAVMNWPHLEILRGETPDGIEFLILAPHATRRPVVIETSDPYAGGRY
jgi:hypothetical protein